MIPFQIDAEGKPMTNQKSSGRCWLFAALNVIRLPFIKQLNLEDFEFSQLYLFFWDKIERCNFVLHNIVETAKRNEPVDGRLVSFLLHVSIIRTFNLLFDFFLSVYNRVTFVVSSNIINQKIIFFYNFIIY